MSNVAATIEAIKLDPKINLHTRMRWIMIAMRVLNVTQITSENVSTIEQTAADLYKEDVARRVGRHDYFVGSKRLPFEKFEKAIHLLWDGERIYDVERKSGVGHNALSAFNQWWKHHKNRFDSNDMYAIYIGFLRRNLKKTH